MHGRVITKLFKPSLSKIPKTKYLQEAKMNFSTSLFLKSFSVVLGSVVGLTVLTSIAKATPASILKPSSTIYDKAPHNGLRMAPPEYPPNVTIRLRGEPVPVTSLITQGQPTQPLSPEEEQTVITTITLKAGRVNVRLRNMTNTSITYQVLQHTAPRALDGKKEVLLKNLPAPVSITFLRPDRGLIKAIPEKGSKTGVLGLTLHEATGLNDSQNTVRIKSNGEVLAY